MRKLFIFGLLTLLAAACTVETVPVVGPPGVACWDTNANRIEDAEEDINTDEEWDAQDCLGSPGPAGVSPFSYADPSMTDIFYSEGRVGIGTMAPSARLEVSAPESTSSVARFFDPLAGGEFALDFEGGTPVLRVTNFKAFNGGRLVVGGGDDTAPDDGGGIVVFENNAVERARISVRRVPIDGSFPMNFLVGDDSSPVMTMLPSGNIGIGTTTPASALHVASVGGNVTIARFLDATTNSGFRLTINDQMDSLGYGAPNRHGIKVGTAESLAFLTGSTDVPRLIVDTDGSVGIGIAAPAAKLHVSGDILASGAITPGCSRALKTDIRKLSLDEAYQAFTAMQAVRFRYKAAPAEEQVGFIAEDVPEILATNDRKGVAPMDVAAVLTRVVQGQDATIRAQQQLIDKQQRQLNDVLARLQRLERQPRKQ